MIGSLILGLITFMIVCICAYLYAINLNYDFDIPSDEITPEEEMRLMMDARHGGLSRHWNWDE